MSNQQAVHNRQDLEKRLVELTKWLRAAGAEILVPGNGWEVLRYRADGHTHVIYADKAGKLTMGPGILVMLDAFQHGKPWSAGVKITRRRTIGPEKRTLLARDGDRCWLCGFQLGDDMSIEHLCSVIDGGPNHLSNKVLTHQDCNQRLGHQAVAEKVRMREREQGMTS